MVIPRMIIVALSFFTLSLHDVTCHKAQFRVLGLQYATLNQRFELEIKLLHQELTTAKSDIQDLKGDNSRIIQMFEVFTTEVKDLKSALSQEKLKFQSLETDFKNLQGQFEDFKVESQLRYENSENKTKDVVNSSQKPDASIESTNIKDKTGNIVLYKIDEESNHLGEGRKITEADRQTVSKVIESPGKDYQLCVAKYGEDKSCFVDVNKRSVANCVSYLGSGVRAVTVDSDKGKLYWSDDNRKSIMSSALNGTDVKVVAENVTTLGLGIDSYHQVLFYTNVSGDIFRIRPTEINTRRFIWTNVGEKPRRIYLDQQNQIIYAITNQWTGIVSINYSTNKRDMVVDTQGRIKSLTVESKNQILYFSVNTSIYAKDLVDKATFAIFHGTSIPSDLVIYGDYMYIVYYYLNKIDVMDLETRDLIQSIYMPWEGRGNTVSMCLIQGH